MFRTRLGLAADEAMDNYRLDVARMFLLVKEGRNEEALTVARDGLVCWRGNYEFESLAGAIFVVLGAFDDARAIIEEMSRETPDALTWPPWDRTWRTYHAFILQEAGEADRSAALLEESLRSLERGGTLGPAVTRA